MPVKSAAREAAGSVKQWAGATVPAGWLDCNGAAISRATYAALFAAIGTAFGAGDGATTFNVPDFRGRAVLGVGTGTGLTARARGATGGAESHTLSAAESGVPAHAHTASADSQGSHTHTGGVTSLAGYGNAAPDDGRGISGTSATGAGGTHAHTITVNASTAAAASSAHNNMQPFGCAYHIIKA